MPARLLVTPNAVAPVLFNLIRGVNPDAEQRNLAAAYFADTGAPVDFRSFQRFTDSLIQSLPRQRKLLELVPQWQEVFDGTAVTRAQSEAFIRQYLAALDHSLFVKLPVFVGRFTGQGHHTINFGGFGDTQVDSWLLVRTLSGQARFRAGLRDFALVPGQLVLIEPGTLTDFSDAGSAHWQFYWVVFQCGDSWRPYLQWPVAGPGVRLLDIAGEGVAAIDVTLDQLYRNFIDSGPRKTELDHNLLEQLLLRCASCLPRDAGRALDARVLAARAFIDAHYTEDIGLADIAAAANLSPSRLSGLFRQETGASVMAYRNELRLVKAAQLLLHSNLRVAQIGQRVGYTEQAFFSRIFRRHLGMSPRQYRTNMSRFDGQHMISNHAD